MGMQVILLLLSMSVIVSSQPPCKTFAELYSNGRGLCDRMFGDAFVYTEGDSSQAYTMWHFQADNPNDAVTIARNASVPDTCQVQYFHKTAPGPEPDTFTECHPWKDNACCNQETVESAEKLRISYGPAYHWDRCGPLTPECERFFVQEACFYECDVNAGLFRRFPPGVYNASDPNHNTWELYQMPIQADYCDAWFTACRHDLFCAEDDGNFFSCAREYEAPASPSTDDASISSGALAGIVVAVLVAVALLVLLVILIFRERQGRAMFMPLASKEEADIDLSAGQPYSESASMTTQNV